MGRTSRHPQRGRLRHGGAGADPAGRRRPQRTSAWGARTPLTSRRLLLVDDDPGILRGLKWSFGEYEVFTASDRDSALRQVRNHRPAVVTLDLGLPPAP